MKLYEITWLDAFISLKAYSQDNASNRKGLQELKTVGYLVHEDDLRIVMAMQYNTDKDKQVRNVTWIPKSCITSRVELKESKVRKQKE